MNFFELMLYIKELNIFAINVEKQMILIFARMMIKIL